MKEHTRLLLGGLAATLLLATAIHTAEASRLSISNTGLRIVWRELRFAERTATGGPEFKCPVTLEGTLHSRTIQKVSGALIGYITRAIVNPNEPPCVYAGGASRVAILAETLPWHVGFARIVGTLPNIQRVYLLLLGISFRLEILGGLVRCLFASTSARPLQAIAELNEATGEVNGLRADETVPIPIAPGQSGSCPQTLIFSGSATVTLLGNTAKITIRLI